MVKNEAQSCPAAEKRGRGRPQQMDAATRRAHIIEAATTLMHSDAFEDISMSAVAREAGMSKRTLYELFDSREALLGAAIEEIGRNLFKPLSELDRARDLPERLCLLLTMDAPRKDEARKVEFLRTIISKAHLYQAIAISVCENGRGVVVRNIREELDRALEIGEIELADEEITTAAECLVDMAFHSPVPRLLDPDLPTPTAEEVRERREFAVRIFLKGCRTKP